MAETGNGMPKRWKCPACGWVRAEVPDEDAK